MKRIFFILFLLFGFLSCDDETLSKEQEFALLQSQFEEITAIAESVSCENSDDWAFIHFGSKACGGPQGYIAYSLTINTTSFLNKIETHRKAEKQFNKKWGIISDCSMSPAPVNVTCKDGKPILGYMFTK